MAEPIGETKRYLESPPCRESLIPFVEFITARHTAHGGVTEIRILGGPGNRKGTWCGYFDKEHWRHLINSILPLTNSPRSKIPFGGYPRSGEGNIYFSLRPVHPDLLGRVANNIQWAAQTTSDEDVIAYDCVGIDVDPVRKSQISASDEEKHNAYQVALNIKNWFLENHIKTIWADSGNGYHLLTPTIPYKGEQLAWAAEQAKLLLHFLAEHFNTGQAKVDTSIFNPARIMRLYGTLTMKGSNLVGKRPHRYSTIDLKEIPEDIDLFAMLGNTIEEYRKEIADRRKTKTSVLSTTVPSLPPNKRSWSREECIQVLEGILTLAGITFRKEEKGDRVLFIFEKCPYHCDDDGHTYECCVMVEPDGRYSASCKHDSDAHWKDFKVVIGWEQHKEGVLKSLGLWRGQGGVSATPPEPPVDLDAELADIKEKWPGTIEEKERNDLLTAAISRIVRCPVLERSRALEEIQKITGYKRKLLEQVISEQKHLDKEKRKESKQTSDEEADADSDSKGDGLPWINAADGEIKRMAAKSWAAMINANDPEHFFRCGGVLMRMEQDDHGIEFSREMSQDRMRHALARVAHFFIIKKKGEEEKVILVPPPLDVVRDMLADPDPPLPILNRIVEFPLFFEDGGLQRVPGYHKPSRTYYAPIPGFTLPQVPESPSSSDMAKALGFVEELLWDFPFVGESERAHAIALILLPAVRELIDGPTPLHLIEAPSPGTGKGLLMEVLAYVMTGRWPAMMTEGRDEDEWRKRITSKLLGLPSMIVIDNLRRRLDSASFSSALTASFWEDRILGQSKIVRLPVRCVWVTSGNNPSLSHEVSRRTVRIRLDARVDRPWLRQGFRHSNLRGWVKEHRAELVWAVLTFVRAWLASGRRSWQGPILGMFDSWSKVIGGILEAVGIKGFLGNLNELYENSDAEGAIWRSFVKAWWDKFADQEVGVSELFEMANSQDEPPELGKGTEQSRKTKLGQELVKMRDRQFDNLRMVLAGERKRAKKWKLVSVPSQAGEPQDRFTHSTPIGSSNKRIENSTKSNNGEPGEPFSDPDARATKISSNNGKNEYCLEKKESQTGSPGSPGSPQDIAAEQSDLDLLEGSL